MNVPFHLRRRGDRRAAVAALVPGRAAAPVLDLCARLGLDPGGKVFPVAGGLLLALDDPTHHPLPGAVRLRALADHLYLPADADLVPALLDDEAAALTRDRGLVFLPGGRLLAFDPARPVPPHELARAPAPSAASWRALPEPPRLAGRIEEVVFDRPDDRPESILDGDGGAGGSGAAAIGTESPRPPAAGAASTLLGRAALGAGRGVARLGQALGSGRLSGLGAGLMGRALRLAPRLGEDVLGRQAAALRELLRQFREGDVDAALRRAIPMGDPGEGRGADAYSGDRLPATDLSYDLRGLLHDPGSPRGGAVSRWFGGGDVMAELTREYRKAAEDAVRRGDFRRAAAIYGKLLRDYRSAAHALTRGGLHHDAAVLFLARLDDRRAAAHAFAAAGEFDRALQLYRDVGDHVRAGDLLRSIGEEPAALAEYALEAGRLAGSPDGQLAAGAFYLEKVGRPDLAAACFAAGWALRPGGNAVSCALALARHHADAADLPALAALADEADGYFEVLLAPVDAGRFYNGLADLADRPALAAAREELRDRARMGLASQVRRQAAPGVPLGRLVSDLFGVARPWPAPVVSDAAFAAAAATRAPAPAPPSAPAATAATGFRRLRVAHGRVAAVAAAAETGEVFLGFEGGEVYAFRPATSEVSLVAAYTRPVTALATNAAGSCLVVLRDASAEGGCVSAFERRPDGTFHLLTGSTRVGPSGSWLTPVERWRGEEAFGLYDGTALGVRSVATLALLHAVALPDPSRPAAALIVGDEPPTFLAHDDDEWFFLVSGERRPAVLSWRAWPAEQTSPRSVPLQAAREPDGARTFAAVDGLGTLWWARLTPDPARPPAVAAREGDYVAAGLLRGGLVAAVTRSRVEWLQRRGPDRLAVWKTTAAPLASAVACAPAEAAGELTVVGGDGILTRVPIPGH